MRIFVGYAVGSALDVVARTIGKKLEEAWPAGVVIENRPGAGAAIAVSTVGTAPPDGNTLLFASVGEISISPNVYRKLPYDPAALVPVTEVMVGDVTFAVGAQQPSATLKDWIAAHRDKPSVFVGTFGPGTPHHLVSAMLADASGLKIEPVHFKSVSDMLNGLVMGDLHGTFCSGTLASQWEKAGKAKALGVSTPFRSAILPNAPAFREVGLQKAEFLGWVGMFAPPGTPAALVERVNAATLAAIRAPEVAAKLADFGFKVTGANPPEFAETTRADRVRYGKVVDAIGMKLD